jgi:hypothetical protein
MDEELAKMLQQDEEFIASEILAQRLLLEEEETQRVGVKEIVLETNVSSVAHTLVSNTISLYIILQYILTSV